MQLSAIRTRVRLEIAEPSAGFWTDAQIDYYINDAAARFASDTGMLTAAPRQTDIVANSTFYTLPPDCPGPHAIMAVYRETTVIDATSVSAIVRADGNPHADTGSPTKWYTVNSGGDTYLAVYPTPTSGTTNGLKIWYWKLSTDMTVDTDECDIPDEYIKGVIWGASTAAFLQRRMIDEGRAYEEKYQAEVARAGAYVDAIVAAGLQDRDASRDNVRTIF